MRNITRDKAQQLYSLVFGKYIVDELIHKKLQKTDNKLQNKYEFPAVCYLHFVDYYC